MIPDSIQQLDVNDPLADKRQLFLLPDEKIYLNGNSLGPLSIAARDRVREVVEQQWGTGLVKSWNQHNWIDLPIKVGNKIAPLIGASSGEVICCDSVSVNLFKLLSSATKLQQAGNSSNKVTILSKQDNFPTDLYIAKGLSDLSGHSEIELITADEENLGKSLERADVLLLTQVNFRSGKLHDIERITQRAREHHCRVIWDLSHSAGVLPLRMNQWQVDMAVGCGYKYLNGGPGAPAFIYMSQELQNTVRQPLQGWMGHLAPFEFSPIYEPDVGINRMQSGTPPIISMSALDAALDCFENIELSQLHEKAMGLSRVFLDSLKAHDAPGSLQMTSPADPVLRGAQIGLSHDHAYAISQTLCAEGIVTDYRRPNILRFGFSPLFLRYQDAWQAGARLTNIVQESLYKDQRFNVENKVT